MPRQTNVTIDFTKIKGKFKPMHGVGQPPNTGLSCSMYHYLTRADISF